ncbi:MAG: EamA family transporter [Betaproteobacteria bacterium]|nr:EamA family transporter [Betaproteobacteria bacterium]
MRRSPYFPYLLLAVAVLFWAGNWVFARALRFDVPPVALAFWRWMVALVILTPFAYAHVRRQWSDIKSALPILALLALLATVFQHIPVYIGLRETTATNGALLNSITPVFILMLSRALVGERLSIMQIAGVSMSLAGVAVILAAGDLAALANLELNRGDLWVLVATLSWAIYTVCLRWRPAQLNLLAMLWVIAVIGVVAMVPFYAWEISAGRTFQPTTAVLSCLLYIGALSTVVSYVFWNRAVQQIGANRAGPFMYLMLVYTPLLAIVFLGERLHLYHLAGCVLILGGIYLTTRGRPVSAPPDL